MKMQSVTSSFIDSVGYDPATGSMTVKFANGSMQMHPSSEREYKELLNADSVGSHYNKNYRTTATKPAVKKNPVR